MPLRFITKSSKADNTVQPKLVFWGLGVEIINAITERRLSWRRNQKSKRYPLSGQHNRKKTHRTARSYFPVHLCSPRKTLTNTPKLPGVRSILRWQAVVLSCEGLSLHLRLERTMFTIVQKCTLKSFVYIHTYTYNYYLYIIIWLESEKPKRDDVLSQE